MRGVILLFFLFILFPCVHGIGLSSEPMDGPIYFEPGVSYRIDYKITAFTDNASVYVRDLYDDPVRMARFAHVGPVTTRGDVKYFTLTIEFPENATVSQGGRHGVVVGVRDEKESSGQFSARTAVEKFVEVWVLYDEKMMEAKLAADSMNINESSTFRLELVSWSLQDISFVSASVRISDPDGTLKETIDTDTVPLPSGSRKTLKIPFSSQGYAAGTYTAIADVRWDGNTTTKRSSFSIGRESLDILNYTRELTEGEIAPFSIHVKSGWNDPMRHVYAIVKIDGREVMRTPGMELKPWKEARLTNYLDAAGIAPGTHDLSLEVHFNGRKEIVKDSIMVKAGEKEASLSSPAGLGNQGLVIVLAVALAIMVFINIYWMSKKR